MADRRDAARMSPLARYLRSRKDAGMSYREMERRARSQGHELSNSAIGMIANDKYRHRVPPDTLEALAAALGDVTARFLAELDDQRWGLGQGWRQEAEEPGDRVLAAIDADSEFTAEEKAAMHSLAGMFRARHRNSPNGSPETRQFG